MIESVDTPTESNEKGRSNDDEENVSEENEAHCERRSFFVMGVEQKEDWNLLCFLAKGTLKNLRTDFNIPYPRTYVSCS